MSPAGRRSRLYEYTADIILWAAVEDYAPLWNFEWELNTACSDLQGRLRPLARAVLLTMFERDWLRLYRGPIDGPLPMAMEKQEALAALLNDQWWEPRPHGHEAVFASATFAGEVAQRANDASMHFLHAVQHIVHLLDPEAAGRSGLSERTVATRIGALTQPGASPSTGVLSDGTTYSVQPPECLFRLPDGREIRLHFDLLPPRITFDVPSLIGFAATAQVTVDRTVHGKPVQATDVADAVRWLARDGHLIEVRPGWYSPVLPARAPWDGTLH